MDNGIKKFQKDNNLKIDGIMKPSGETERTLYEHLTRQSADDVFILSQNDAGTVGFGGNVEVDETYYGKKKVRPTKRTDGTPFTSTGKGAHKLAVVSMVERGGKVKSFHVDRADKVTVAEIVVKNVSKESKLHTDESRLYTGADAHVSEHNTVRHASGEYVRGNVHTNTIEGYFSVFKKGMNGVFQHCQEKNLHRYLSEFDFKYNTRQALGYSDQDRANLMLLSVVGKRLKYERPSTYA